MCTICCGIFQNIQCDMYTQCIFNLICFIQLHQVMIEFKELIDSEKPKSMTVTNFFVFILHLQELTSFVNDFNSYEHKLH